jgi:hypothetical protein
MAILSHLVQEKRRRERVREVQPRLLFAPRGQVVEFQSRPVTSAVIAGVARIMPGRQQKFHVAASLLARRRKSR